MFRRKQTSREDRILSRERLSRLLTGQLLQRVRKRRLEKTRGAHVVKPREKRDEETGGPDTDG